MSIIYILEWRHSFGAKVLQGVKKKTAPSRQSLNVGVSSYDVKKKQNLHSEEKTLISSRHNTFPLHRVKYSSRAYKMVTENRTWRTDGCITQLMLVTVPLYPQWTASGVKPRLLTETGTISIFIPRNRLCIYFILAVTVHNLLSKAGYPIMWGKVPTTASNSSHWTNINLFDSFERRLSCCILQILLPDIKMCGCYKQTMQLFLPPHSRKEPLHNESHLNRVRSVSASCTF